MYLWRRLATPQWWIDNEESLRAQFGTKLTVIEQLNRRRLQIEVACGSPRAPKQFGGRVKKLPRDWLQQILGKQKTQPLKVGNRKLIIPAGAAFGTGAHATTAMSLRLLEHVTQRWEPGWSLVDLGTGSGILALAARFLGAGRVVAIDVDPVAVSAAKENARRNKIDSVDFRVADVRRWKFPRSIDIISANLFSELLIEILPKLRASYYLILSGVLRIQERELRRALRSHKIDIIEVCRRGKWVAVAAKTNLTR